MSILIIESEYTHIYRRVYSFVKEVWHMTMTGTEKRGGTNPLKRPVCSLIMAAAVLESIPRLEIYALIRQVAAVIIAVTHVRAGSLRCSLCVGDCRGAWCLLPGRGALPLAIRGGNVV